MYIFIYRYMYTYAFNIVFLLITYVCIIDLQN